MTGPVARLRQQASARGERLMMPDQVTITRVIGHTTSPINGVVSENTVTLYTGKARIKSVSSMARPETIAGQVEQVERRGITCEVPLNSGPYRSDDTVTVTASPRSDLIGRTYHVTVIESSDNARCQRLSLVSVQ
jgi:Family of unknown function (DUF6093)